MVSQKWVVKMFAISASRKSRTTLHAVTALIAVAIGIGVSTLDALAGTLVNQGQPNGSIIYTPGSPSRVLTAINDLSNYIYQTSGANVPVIGDPGNNSPAGFNIRIGSTTAAPVNPASITEQQVGLDGFIIQNTSDGIVISGNSPEGTANGIYYFAEKMLGATWLSPEDSGPTFTHQTTIDIAPQNLTIKPDSKWRGQYYSFQQNPNYDANGPFAKGINANRDKWWIFNRVNSPPTYEVNTYHAFSEIVPDSLFATHPEYFPLINYTFGPSSNHLDPYENRIPTGTSQRRHDNNTFQRELGNPAVLQLAINWTRAQFDANPNLKYVTLSANDGPWWSVSPESQALGPTDSARNLAFVNAVAEANEALYPDRKYAFVAYEGTLEPPAGMTVHPNVLPVIAPLRVGRVHSINSNDEPDSVYLRQIIDGWAAISSEIAYRPYMNAGPLMTPGALTLSDEAKYLRDHGSIGGFREHQQLPGVGWALANWMEVQLMWDADQDPVTLRRQFSNGYYGTLAGPVVDKIYGDVETRMRNTVVPGDPNAQVEDPNYMRPLIEPSAGAIAVATHAAQFQSSTYRERLTRDMGVLGSFAMPAVFSDNFDNKSGTLTGKAADTGQVWQQFSLFQDTGGPYGSLSVSTAHGLHGSRGAGTNTNAFKGNTVALGTTLTDGHVQVDLDMQTQQPGYYDSTTPLKYWWLRDSVSGNLAAVYWESDGDVGFEGLGITSPVTPSGMSVNGSMHVSLDIDLDLKTVLFTWFDNDDPSDASTRGALNLGPYNVNFAPNVFDIWGRGESNVINSGFDNISIRALSLPMGDADLDGDVDLSDLGALATHYGATSGRSWLDGDFDFDGDVDLSDLGTLATHYGAGQAQAMADFLTLVPEPASLFWICAIPLALARGLRIRATGT